MTIFTDIVFTASQKGNSDSIDFLSSTVTHYGTEVVIPFSQYIVGKKMILFAHETNYEM